MKAAYEATSKKEEARSKMGNVLCAQDRHSVINAMDGLLVTVTVTLTVNVRLSVTVSLSTSVPHSLSVSVCVCLCVLFGQLAAPEQLLMRHDNWAADDLWLTRV